MGRRSDYKQERNYENLQKAMYVGAGEYDIPQLQPVKDVDVERWVPFNCAKTLRQTDNTGIHFFIDDYQFERVWRFPDKYIGFFKQFGAVCTPDFSPYADFPKAIQIYNCYRKHWCGAYWQEHGIKVIPTINWSSPETLEFALDGEPVGGIVAMSSEGISRSEESKDWLVESYTEMKAWLKPIKVLWKGRIPSELADDEASGLICPIATFNSKWRVLDGGAKKGV